MALLKRPSGLLIDLSGTIHIEDKVVASSIEAIRVLRHKRIPFLFVTNTTKVSFILLKGYFGGFVDVFVRYLLLIR